MRGRNSTAENKIVFVLSGLVASCPLHKLRASGEDQAKRLQGGHLHTDRELSVISLNLQEWRLKGLLLSISLVDCTQYGTPD